MHKISSTELFFDCESFNKPKRLKNSDNGTDSGKPKRCKRAASKIFEPRN